VATIVTLAAAAPHVYYYMVHVPSQYGIRYLSLLTGPAELLLWFPLFLALAAHAVWSSERPTMPGPLMLWTVAALVVLLPASALAFAKVGGTLNSFLPAMFAMVFFCALQLRDIVPALGDRGRPVTGRVGTGLVLAALIALPSMRLYHNLGYFTYFDDYPRVIALAHGLPAGRVLAPEDPTITLFARGTVSRNIYLEYDNAPAEDARPRRTPKELPPYVAAEIGAADYVVDVKDWWSDLLEPRQLERLGFEPVTDLPHYTIWRRRMVSLRGSGPTP
jgi:hypothetical protein